MATSSSKRHKQVHPIGRVKPVVKKTKAPSGASFKEKHSTVGKSVKKSLSVKSVAKKQVAPAKSIVAKKQPAAAVNKPATTVKKPVATVKPVSAASQRAAKVKPRATAKGKAGSKANFQSPKAAPAAGKFKASPAVVPISNTPVQPAKPRKNPAGLSAKDLQFFTEQLLAKRRELVGDMSSMEREALRSGSGSNLSTLPMHMADMGTDNFEQEFTLGLVEKDRNLLREINHALSKILNGTYGICEGTGLPIAKVRLEAAPWARYGIEYARQREKNGMGVRTL